MKKRNISIYINVLIIIFEIMGLIHNYIYNNRISIEYFTEEANILALISSIIFVIYLIINKKIPNWLKLMKYTSTVGLTITFLVVLFILYPMSGFNFYGMFISGTLLYHHLLCPLLGFISFIFFDNLSKYDKSDIKYGLIHMGVYGIVLVILNILKVINGPYPFLMVYNQTIIVSIIWFIVLYLLGYIISYTLIVLHNLR